MAAAPHPLTVVGCTVCGAQVVGIELLRQHHQAAHSGGADCHLPAVRIADIPILPDSPSHSQTGSMAVRKVDISLGNIFFFEIV